MNFIDFLVRKFKLNHHHVSIDCSCDKEAELLHKQVQISCDQVMTRLATIENLVDNT